MIPTPRPLIDLVLTVLARTVLRGFFRSVEVAGDVDVVRGRPMMVVANHFYGFVDPVVLVHVFGRIPRFLAKSTLFENAALRPLLWLAGVIPTYRQQDGSDTGRNVGSFDAATRVLARGGLIGIFPEGTTHDDPSIRPVRTGAARLALQAYADGVEDLVIVPVGIVFDDKIALRSRVLARVGAPVEVGDVVARLTAAGMAATSSDRDAVRTLTAMIEERLRAVAPDYREPRLPHMLRRAAGVACRARPGARVGQVSLADEEELARRIVTAGPAAVEEVDRALARYHLDLDIAGIGDLQIEERHSVTELLRRTLAASFRLVLLTPFAVVGLAWNVLPYTLVQMAGRAVPRPVTKGTIRLSTALLLFPAMWVLVAMNDAWTGFWPGLGVVLVAPALGIVAVAWLEGLVKGYRDWRGWIALTDRRALLPDVERSRAEVAAAVARAVGELP